MNNYNIKILLDTSVLVSYIGQNKSHTPARIKTAQTIINHFQNKKGYILCYSERSKIELKDDKNVTILQKFSLLGSHSLNLTLKMNNLTLRNSNSKWGDNNEIKLGNLLDKILPDKTHKNNQGDRGIYGDAVFEKCEVILHENPRDFLKFDEDSKERKTLLINLLVLC